VSRQAPWRAYLAAVEPVWCQLGVSVLDVVAGARREGHRILPYHRSDSSLIGAVSNFVVVD
jgi:hypothetical protein